MIQTSPIIGGYKMVPSGRESHSAWSVAHGVTTFFFPEMELPVKAFYGHQGVF